MINKPKISIIIITKNRQSKLKNCLRAISKNTFQEFELIVIDQSDKNKNPDQFSSYFRKNKNLIYIKSATTGKSKGLNLAIKKSASPIIAFTDDDCLPHKEWIKNIVKNFEKDKKIAGLYGRTLPYQPKQNKELVCPSTFDKKESKYIRKPCKHWENIGFGNNMAWKKSFFNKYGLFKEWLGPGSIGKGAEDAEIALRALTNQQVIFYNPEMLVYHDNWQTKKENQKQELSYICGETACYGYFGMLGYEIGRKVIKENLIDCLFIFKENSLLKTANKLRGILIAKMAYYNKSN